MEVTENGRSCVCYQCLSTIQFNGNEFSDMSLEQNKSTVKYTIVLYKTFKL